MNNTATHEDPQLRPASDLSELAHRTQVFRRRIIYLAMGVVVIGLGLASRSRFLSLPPPVAKYGGDALWALLVYLSVSALLPRTGAIRRGVLALTISTTVEFSQLFHPPWLDAIRRTTLGILILGNTFNWPDLPSYVAGIVAGVLIELQMPALRKLDPKANAGMS